MAYLKKRYFDGRDVWPDAIRAIIRVIPGQGTTKSLDLGIWRNTADFAAHPDLPIYVENPMLGIDSFDHFEILTALRYLYPEKYGDTPGQFISGNPDDESIDVSEVVEE